MRKNLMKTISEKFSKPESMTFWKIISLMYRLDISEGKVRYALSPFCEEEPALALANLIINRQKQRNLSKSEYKQPPLEDEDAYQ